MQTITEGGRRPEGDVQTVGGEYPCLTSVLLLDARLMWQGWLSLALLPWLSIAAGLAPGQPATGGGGDPSFDVVPAAKHARRAGNVVYVDFR